MHVPTSIRVVAATAALLLLAACSREPASAAGVAEIRLRVPSMHCTGCEAAIETSVAGVPGVVSCDAVFDAGTVIVELAAPATEAAVIAAIEKLEYPVER